MSTNTNIITVDNNDDLVFNAPLKMDEYEINPSNGGVLANGVPYQGSSGGMSGARDYVGIKCVLPSASEMGSSVVKVGIDFAELENEEIYKVLIYMDPPEFVLPGTGNFIETVEYEITILNFYQYADPPIFYTNMYSSESSIVTYTDNSTPDYNRYNVVVNYPAALYSPVNLWMRPGDCSLFMELIL